MRPVLRSALLMLASTSTALAVPVDIDPAGFAAWYRVGAAYVSQGPTTMDLAPGSHTVSTTFGVWGFDVDAGGVVTPVGSEDSLTGGAGTLTFDTTSVTIDPGLMDGSTQIYPVYRASGVVTATLINGVSDYTVGHLGRDPATFDLDATGAIAVTSPTRASASGGTLSLATVTVTLEPLLYGGQYALSHLPYAVGAESFVAVPDSEYHVNIAGFVTHYFRIEADGTVTTTRSPEAFAGTGSTVEFLTRPITIDPGAMVGAWDIHRGPPPHTQGGLGVVDLPPGRYALYPGSYGGASITVLDDGSITSTSPAVTTSGSVLTVVTHPVTITPDDPTVPWRLWIHDRYSSYRTGEHTIEMAPGLRYSLDVPPSGYWQTPFDLLAPCGFVSDTVTPPAGNVSFTLSCGTPVVDTDGDGVDDIADNCPLVANADQVDRDVDGSGDACDDDDDGDGVLDGADNCPLVANAGQEDFDLDGLGDVCDDDDDDDGVSDDIDNCVGLSNVDQADGDGDGLGDQCDDDDDDDGVLDTADNCLNTPNPDQADQDGDGDGDVCDGDRDGDGVANDNDTCDATQSGTPVTSDGCDAGQSIALQCDPLTFNNHGQYVSCVAHAAQDAVELGLIDPQGKAGFIKTAAKK